MNGDAATLHLTYHRIGNNGSTYPYMLTMLQFQEHLAIARALGCDGGHRYLHPAFTFDDGHGSNYSEAGPLLAENGFSGTFFITASWIQQRAEFMTWSEVKALRSSGHGIGSHGWSHKLLTRCTDAALDHELRRSKDVLEQKLGAVVDSISLPGGRWDRRVLRACAAAGYRSVFTSDPGARIRMKEGVELVPRFNVPGLFTAAQLQNLLAVNSSFMYRIRIKHGTKQLARHMMGDRLYHLFWCVFFGWKSDEDQQSTA